MQITRCPDDLTAARRGRGACRRLAGTLSVAALAALATLLATGCATRATDVLAKPTDPAAYASWGCERLFDEIDTVQYQAADVAYEVDSVAGANMVALGLGVTVFWPALLAMQPDGPEAALLAELKGRFDALRSAAGARACGASPAAMAAGRQAALPVVLGDRLVYDDRARPGGPARSLALRLTALRRDQIEFQVLIDGQPLPAAWRQDLAGNAVPGAAPPLLAWRRLLKPGLVLGQVLSGDLAAADEPVASARLRGQVVATGPQTVAGRAFDVAVIELFGEAPPARNSPGDGAADGAGHSARLDGVMAIDRVSGLLLRLDLRCVNPDFAVQRRLLRVVSAGP